MSVVIFLLCSERKLPVNLICLYGVRVGLVQEAEMEEFKVSRVQIYIYSINIVYIRYIGYKSIYDISLDCIYNLWLLFFNVLSFYFIVFDCLDRPTGADPEAIIVFNGEYVESK